MSFLNPFFLIGSIVLAVPVIIHLVRREKSEVIHFSSLMFLLKVPKRSVRQQIIKNLLLMALRLLILALLVGAFMRPYMTESALPKVLAGQSNGIVMLLDNSYSMRYGTNMDKLKAEANRRIDAMGANDQMALIVFNDSATVLARPTSDKSELKSRVALIEPSFNGTKYYEAFTAAEHALQQFNGKQKQLFMISDFQKAGWNRSSRENVISRDVKVDKVNLGIENSTNVGIDNVNVDATSFTRQFGGRVVARVHNYRKDQPVTVQATLLLNDKEVGGKHVVTISPNSTQLTDFSGFDLPIGASKGKIRIDSDDPLKVDNEFLFAIDRRERQKILIMDAGKPRQSDYLRKVFAASTDLPIEVAVANASGVRPEDLQQYKVVVINDVPSLSNAVRDRLVELRKTGQGQFVVLGQYADLGWWASFPGLPVKPVRKITAVNELGRTSVSITSFDRNHGMFKKFRNSATFTLSTALFYRFTQMELKPGAAALAKFEDGSPALAESSGTDRGLVVFASSLDNKVLDGWNDFPIKASFVPFAIEVARYLSHSDDVREWYALGEGIPIVGSIEGGAAAVIDPNGERIGLGDLEAGQQLFFTPKIPGFHEIRVGHDIRLIAVNPPSNEGNLDMIPPDELVASVQSTAAEAQQKGLYTTEDHLEYAKRQLSWWYLLLIAILAAIAEIIIANRSFRAPSGTLVSGKNSGSGLLGYGRN